MGIQLEVAHLDHKGMGGNPTGSTSRTENLVTLCRHRHQDGTVSLHKGTLRVVPVDPLLGCDGPVRWLVDAGAAFGAVFTERRWVMLAEEVSVGVWSTPSPEQGRLMVELGRLER